MKKLLALAATLFVSAASMALPRYEISAVSDPAQPAAASSDIRLGDGGIYKDGVFTPLPGLPPQGSPDYQTQTWATAFNSFGDVVGSTWTNDPSNDMQTLSWLYTGGQTINLSDHLASSLLQTASVYATDVSDSLLVTGYAEIFGLGQRAVFWDSGTLYLLDQALDPQGWTLYNVVAAADDGTLYGWGEQNGTESWFAATLAAPEVPQGSDSGIPTSPVPEPSTWALLLAGIAFVFYTRRRVRE